jgi:uncharacterized protein YggE
MGRLVAIALGATLALGTLTGCTTKVVTSPGAAEDRITATGEGTALSAPDRAILRFGVLKKDADPRKAMSDASDASNGLSAALKKAGIAEKDLQTGNISLNPDYSNPRNNEPPKIVGYSASIDVVAKTPELKKIGDVIVAATDAGAVNVSGISFELAETNPAKYAAAAEAVKDARKRAEAIAKAAGKSVGDVITIGDPQSVSNDYSMNYTKGMYSLDAGYPGAAAAQIQPGQLREATRVTATFELQ